MPIPSHTGRDVHVTPLSTKFNRNFMPLEANSELPVLLPMYESREVFAMPIMPEPQKLAEAPHRITNVQPLNPMDFMRGDGL